MSNTNILNFLFTTAQSNYNYYAEIPGIQFIHNCAMFTTFGILATLTFWIAFPKFAHQCRIVVASLSVIGFGLVWVELIRAVTIRDPRFLLSELPLHPINNWGFVGSSVFAAYLIFKLPSGMLKTVPTILLKTAFALSLFAIQFIFFESVGIRPL